jgi:hypothetical protein
MPPISYVEDIFPKEPIEDPPKHLLFTVPDNWNSPTCFPGEDKLMVTETLHSHNKDDQTEEPTTCYVKEEILEATDVRVTSGIAKVFMDAGHQNVQRGPQGRHELGEEEAMNLGESLLKDS